MKTISAMYDTMAQAQATVTELLAQGIPNSDINLVANASDAEYAANFTEGNKIHEAGETVTEAGAAVGGIGGLVVGLSFFMIPGIGPVLAAGGLLASLIAGTSLGALAGGAVSVLVELGIASEQAGTYAEGIRRGGALLVVKSSEAVADQAEAVIKRHQPINVEERALSWKQRGWATYDPQAAPYTREQVEAERRSLLSARL